MSKLAVGILISGRGSNMTALIDATAAADYPASIACVISNRADAKGLETAAQKGIPTFTVDHTAYADKAAFEEALTEKLEESGAEFVCLAGFMRLLTATFIDRWSDRLINIHPSLLPAYKGLHTHERALADGVKLAGCTVHFVRPEMDAGPIIAQAAVPVLSADTPDSLAARILTAEHKLYPLALKLVAEGKARVVDGLVDIPSSAVNAGARIFSAG